MFLKRQALRCQPIRSLGYQPPHVISHTGNQVRHQTLYTVSYIAWLHRAHPRAEQNTSRSTTPKNGECKHTRHLPGGRRLVRLSNVDTYNWPRWEYASYSLIFPSLSLIMSQKIITLLPAALVIGVVITAAENYIVTIYRVDHVRS